MLECSLLVDLSEQSHLYEFHVTRIISTPKICGMLGPLYYVFKWYVTVYNIPLLLNTVQPPVMTMAVVESAVFEESKKRFEDSKNCQVR